MQRGDRRILTADVRNGALPTNLCDEVVRAGDDAPRIGVLALQGGYHEHKVMLSRLGASVHEVRQLADLTAEPGFDGLVVPGGESTTLGHLARRLGLLEPLRAFVASGRPVMGTCAGLIFLAGDVVGQKEGGQDFVGGLDVAVRRNFFGKGQVDSFETRLTPSFAPERAVDALFIRAPAITRVGDGVEVLASLDYASVGLSKEPADHPVAVQQGALVGLTFHPELTREDCWHAHFMRLVRERSAGGTGNGNGAAVAPTKSKKAAEGGGEAPAPKKRRGGKRN